MVEEGECGESLTGRIGYRCLRQQQQLRDRFLFTSNSVSLALLEGLSSSFAWEKMRRKVGSDLRTNDTKSAEERHYCRRTSNGSWWQWESEVSERDIRGAVRVSQLIGSNVRRELTNARRESSKLWKQRHGGRERRKGREQVKGFIWFFSTQFTSVGKQNALVKQRNNLP